MEYSLEKKVFDLFEHESNNWQLARTKYLDFAQSELKFFDFGNFKIEVIYNSARIRSTLADVKKKLENIREGKDSFISKEENSEDSCFLCQNIRPSEQKFIDSGDFQILVNPYPIFPKHFTIAHHTHTPQLLMPYFFDYLDFAKHLPSLAVFYNGSNCGASAPHHVHFQAAEKRFFNVVGDYNSLDCSNFEIIDQSSDFSLKRFKNYLRRAYCIETAKKDIAKDIALKHFAAPITENMLNVITVFEQGNYRIFIFPRKKFRPSQFFEKDTSKQLLISPASVELSGRFVTVFKEHFDRISKNEIVDIYSQIS